MLPLPNFRPNNWRLATSVLALLAVLTGLLGILGWVFDNAFLRSFLSDGASMKINTALLLIFGGSALWLQNKGFVKGVIVLGGLMAALSLLIVIEHLFYVNLHIDELIAKDPFTDAHKEVPGRTSILSAVDALIIGCSLLLLSFRRYRVAQLMATMAFILVYISLTGHIFHINGFYYLGKYSGIAFHTALGLLLLATGVLTCSAGHGWIAVIYQRLAKSNLLIYFLSYFLGAAPLFAALYLFIIQKGTLSPASDVAVLIILTVVLSMPVAYFLLKLVNRMGKELSIADKKLEIALDAAKLGSYDLDLQTNNMVCTPQCKANYGLPEDAVFNFAELLESIVPQHREKMQQKVQLAIENNGVYHDEYQVRWPDGTLHWINVSGKPSYNNAGEAISITGVTFDNTAQVDAKNELERALEQSRLSKEAAQLGLFDMDLENGTLEWDERCRLLFGITHKDVVTYEKDFITGLHPDDRERVTKLISDLFIPETSNGEYDVEYRTIGVENDITRWVRAKGRVYFVNDKPVRFIGSVLDITDGKNYEQALQAINEEMAAANEEMASTNEELIATQQDLEDLLQKFSQSDRKFRSLVQDAPVAINVLRGKDLIMESANKMMLQIIGKTNEEIIGKPYGEALRELADQPFHGLLKRVYETSETYYGNEAKATLVRDGQKVDGYFNFIYQPIKNTEGLTDGVIIVATDVTDLVIARKERENAEEKLGLAVEAAKIGSWHIDPQTKALKYNHMLAQIFGYEGETPMTYDQAIAQVTEEHRDRILAEIELTILNGADYDITYQQKKFNDGAIIWLRSVGKISPDALGDFTVFSGVVMDVTEQKRDELRKNDFIGMVSHELKTPLTSLTAIVQVAAGKLKNSEDTFLSGAMEKAKLQVKRMSNMINGFLNVSRLEAGKISIDKHNFNLDELVVESIKENELTLSTHIIHVNICDHVLVNADRDKINSVISNLLSNAIKYSPKGSEIEVKCQLSDKEALISVKDEGLGISEQDREKLFERFYRVESNAAYISGFGIGLYLSAEIIERHHGRIWVDSEIGHGSTFHFTLPLK